MAGASPRRNQNFREAEEKGVEIALLFDLIYSGYVTYSHVAQKDRWYPR